MLTTEVLLSHNLCCPHDPRLMTSIFAFKDSIRRLYNCQDIGMDIESLRLQHTSFGFEVETDILTHPWDDTLDLFKGIDPAYYVYVVFPPVNDPEEGIYESFEALPELRTFFDLQDFNVKLNSSRIGHRKSTVGRYFFQSDVDVDPMEEIGVAPEPKVFQSKQEQQREAARLKINTLPAELTNGQKTSITAAQDQVHRAAIEEEAFINKEEKRVSESDYYVLQQAFAGGDNRSGPPVDLCMRLLLATQREDGLYKSPLLEKFVTSHFYHYQISGAVGIILKLYGQIDAEALLLATDYLQHPQANMVREAAAQLKDICLHGAILADETGFGKTKQTLLAAVLHSILYMEKDKEGNECHKPVLLVVPPTLISQWLVEIHDHWPCLIPILSYDDSAFRMTDLSVIPAGAMKKFPNVEFLPERLRYIFDKHNKKARQAIIITSYATHRQRTGRVEESQVPGKPYETRTVWTTPFKRKFSLLLADEAQKVKNPETNTWAVLRVHDFPKIILATASPMFNAAKDLIGLVGLLWPAARKALLSYLDKHPEDVETHEEIQDIGTEDMATVLPDLDPISPIRIELLNAQTLKGMFRRRENSLHLRVAARFRDMLDVISIQRSQGSTLPNASGEPISLKPLFKKVTYKTATVSLPPIEELEYQIWHRASADEFAAEVKKQKAQKRGDVLSPDGPVPANNQHPTQAQRSFMAAPGALHKLGIANFATKMARLNAVMESVKGDTYVRSIRDWRERGLDAHFIYDLTRGEGVPSAQTADSLIIYLTQGSPVLRLVFQELLTVKALDRVNKAAYGHHQKLIVGETTPANAFYLQQVLRACLIDARVFHADLSHQAKTKMVDLFNDEYSTLRVLIMLYDVGAVGLNLHKACNRVVIASLPRSRAQESQLAGRALRITSEFPLTVVRRVTPNSHDQFRGVRQAEKAALQLAANAREPSIAQLLVNLLNEFQKDVDQFHLLSDSEKVRVTVPVEDKPKSPSKDRNKNTTPIKKEVASASTPTKNKKPKVFELQASPNPSKSRNLRDRTRKSAYDESGDDDGLFFRTKDPEYIDTGGESSDDEYDLMEAGLSEPDATSAEDDDYLEDEQDDEDEDEKDEEDDGDTSNVDVSLLDDKPNDITRHRQTLLKQAPGKVRTETDLAEEDSLVLGLRLLYNKINGLELLHLEKSIHIHYKQFPKKTVARVKKLKQPNEENQAKAREKGL
ncbi:hypothetical protein ASPCAL04379 [Aspergillus calidoustus]|uniref:Helicase ATP-binding domain-containing protein n=1 Tax=Aspergillus calidoustus TaxID=454130 RepID=A0A0U5FV96_ASPCI|nr:hypothetical protein ASPCAL04379 [Aspergillus calidoustus]